MFVETMEFIGTLIIKIYLFVLGAPFYILNHLVKDDQINPSL
jgi:hypothetical protein